MGLGNTTAKGELAVMKAQLRAAELGFIVSRPTTEGSRYDLIIDDGQLNRVQVKYANGKSGHSDGAVFVHLSSVSRSQKAPKQGYSEDEIDAILVYLPKVDRLCWLPPEIWRDKQAVIVRYEPPKNNQKRGCVIAEEFWW